MSIRQSQKQYKTSPLCNIVKQINFMLKERQRIFHQSITNFTHLSSTFKQLSLSNVDKHLSEYSNIKELIEEINHSCLQRATSGEHTKFWNLNMTIEKDVEDNLRKLKEMDAKLDKTISQEAESCTILEDCEEEIRSILTLKEQNYLAKAEPYLTRKTECLRALTHLKEEKGKIKGQKLSKIAELLQQLQKLKQHRQKRLGYCKDKKLTQQNMSLLKLLLSDLNEIMNQRRNSHHNQVTIKNLNKSLDLTNERIRLVEEELLVLFEEQQRLLGQMQYSCLQNEQHRHFEQELLAKINLKSSDLMAFMDSTATFIRQEEEKKKDLDQIVQGVATTNETIKIFRHIYEAMESQNRRRNDLLAKLENIQKEQEEHFAFEEKMSEIETDLEALQAKKQRLLKKLSSKVSQADLSAYKSVNQELEAVDTESRAKRIILEDMRKDLAQGTKSILNRILALNEDYNDITSEVMPQAVFEQIDYSKEQAANEIRVHLCKLLNRLKI